MATFNCSLSAGRTLPLGRKRVIIIIIIIRITLSTVQYPITATQWHPEKNSFEWARKLQIPHSSAAVSTQVDATLFVSCFSGATSDFAVNCTSCPAVSHSIEKLLWKMQPGLDMLSEVHADECILGA